MSPEQEKAADPNLKWTRFSRYMMAVVCLSILSVMALVSVVAAFQINKLAQTLQARKAQDLARFVGRAAFVPMSLESGPLLEQSVKPYLDDPDLIYLKIYDPSGKVRMSYGSKQSGPELAKASYPVRPATGTSPLGTVSVGIGRTTAHAAARRAALAIAGAGAVILILAVGFGSALVSEMTGRFRDLVGEARMAEELQRSNQELEHFAYAASHDLQEPLRKIVNFSELLAQRYRGKLDGDADGYFAIVVDGAKRMSALISDLLEYSRVGKQERPSTQTDIAVLVQGVLRDLDVPLRESGAAVRLGPLPILKVNPTRIAQLLQNLIANALKFRGEAAPVVEISAERSGADWLFCVKDNGIGIDPQNAGKLFVMFKRLHTRAQYPGTGLGLALCKRIVEQNGGRIWLESQLGQGTRFYFTIPAGKER